MDVKLEIDTEGELSSDGGKDNFCENAMDLVDYNRG
jgi:hypothetical protein